MDTKRITIIAASSVAAASLVFSAFSIFGKKFRSKKHLDIDAQVLKLTKKLSLTDEQVSKVRPFLESHLSDLENIHQQKSSHQKVSKIEIGEREAAFQKEMEEILTPSQNLKFNNKREKIGNHKAKHTATMHS